MGNLSKVTIVKQNSSDKIVIYGNNYNGIKDLAPSSKVKKTEMNDYTFDYYQDKYGMFILRRCELFPCFDRYDRMCENRYYRRYMICKSLEELLEKYNLIVSTDERFNSIEYNSAQLAPLIYADDSMAMIEIMIEKEEV